MAAIAASSAHQMRERFTPNADTHGEPPLVLHLASGKTPYQAARQLLDGAHRRNRDTVLCREIVLSASPSYFRPGREEQGGAYEVDRAKAWATVALAWARKTWPDQLASFVLHLDEQTVHAHLLVVPRVRRDDGSWALNSKALFDRERLRDLQTSFGQAVEPLGIRRGEPGSKAKHSEVAQFYGAVQAAKALPNRAEVPNSPRPPSPPVERSARVLNAVAGLLGIETAYDRAKRAHQVELVRWRRNLRDLREREGGDWERLRAAAAVAPIKARTQSTQQHSGAPLGPPARPVHAPPRQGRP